MTHIFADPSEIGDTLRVRGADFNHIKNVLGRCCGASAG